MPRTAFYVLTVVLAFLGGIEPPSGEIPAESVETLPPIDFWDDKATTSSAESCPWLLSFDGGGRREAGDAFFALGQVALFAVELVALVWPLRKCGAGSLLSQRLRAASCAVPSSHAGCQTDPGREVQALEAKLQAARDGIEETDGSLKQTHSIEDGWRKHKRILAAKLQNERERQVERTRMLQEQQAVSKAQDKKMGKTAADLLVALERFKRSDERLRCCRDELETIRSLKDLLEKIAPEDAEVIEQGGRELRRLREDIVNERAALQGAHVLAGHLEAAAVTARALGYRRALAMLSPAVAPTAGATPSTASGCPPGFLPFCRRHSTPGCLLSSRGSPEDTAGRVLRAPAPKLPGEAKEEEHMVMEVSIASPKASSTSSSSSFMSEGFSSTTCGKSLSQSAQLEPSTPERSRKPPAGKPKSTGSGTRTEETSASTPAKPFASSSFRGPTPVKLEARFCARMPSAGATAKPESVVGSPASICALSTGSGDGADVFPDAESYFTEDG